MNKTWMGLEKLGVEGDVEGVAAAMEAWNALMGGTMMTSYRKYPNTPAPQKDKVGTTGRWLLHMCPLVGVLPVH